MKKIFTILFFFCIMISLFLQVTADNETGSINRIEWWPMNHHDTSNTGFSHSKAPDTNTVLWINTTNDRIISSPAVVNMRVYVGSDDQYLYCFNAETGETLWNFFAGGLIRTSPAVYTNKVYFGVDPGTIVCIRATDGLFQWSYETGSWWMASSPTIKNDRLYIGTQEGILYCFDATPDDNGDGVINQQDFDEGVNDPPNAQYDRIWMYQTGYWIESTPAVTSNRVYVGSHDGFLYCLNAQTGTYVWSYNTSTIDNEGQRFQRSIASSPSLYKQKVIFSATDGTMFCLNATNGDYLWSYKAGLGGDRNSPAIAYDRVYIGSYTVIMVPPYMYQGKLFCVDVNTGQPLWNYTAESTVHFCSVADGKVYFGISNFWVEPDYVYCLNAYSGKYIWRYEVGDYILSTPVIANEKLYVTSYDQAIYCFGGAET